MEAINQYVKNSEILYFCKIDLEGNYTYVSPYFAKFFNFNPDHLYGTSSLLTIYHEDHPKCYEVIEKCYAAPKTYHQVFLRKPLDNNEVIWTQWEFYLDTYENDQPKEIICYGYDVSQKINNLNQLKKVSKQFEENETKFRTLFETSTLGMILHSPNGDLYEANEAFCNIVGINKTEITKYNIAEFTPEEYWEKDKAFIKELLSKDVKYTYEKEFLRNKTEKVPVSINGKTFYDQAGDVLIWCIAKDITEIKQQEKQLNIQKELLEQTAIIAKLGGWEINLDPFKREWTKEVYTIFDIDPKITTKIDHSMEFYHPDDQAILTRAQSLCIKEGTPYDLELRLISAKKTNKWVRVMGKANYSNNEIKSISGIVQDITDKKNIEETLKKQNDLLKDISFTQSHLMRLPIANILGLVDLLDLEDSVEAKNEIYKKIKHSVNQLDLIVREVINKKIID